MTSVLQIAWRYFWFLPLQRGLNSIGAVLLVAGTALMLYGFPGPDFVVSHASLTCALLGSAFIAFGPAFAGGMVLHLSSTRSLLHLRPHGRLRMMLGSTLAITGIAAITAAPLLLNHLINAGPAPLKLFCVLWSCVALFWSATVFLVATPWRMIALMAVTPVLLVTFRKILFQSPAGFVILLVVGLCAWLAFARWYLAVQSIPQPGWLSGTRQTAKPTLMQQLTGSRRESWTRPLAQRQCLFDAVSPWLPMATGSIPALLLAVPWLFIAPTESMRDMPTVWLLFPIAIASSYAYLLIRRARFLWLRAGHDRAGLFHVVELAGLRVAALTMTVTMTAFLAFSLWNRPDQAPLILICAAEQAALAALMFYAGMCATRGWDAGGVLITAGMFLIVISHVVFIRPHHYMSVTFMAGMLVSILLLTTLLRWYARHRWLTLDWRIAKLPQPIRQI